ncbi:uncharacterized protein LOC109511026, partial [Hippocampus comes]|uniref:uncharacterized protein LOC109511026 n=1 Tax=Hippocampus comes TaxID=109280 RepID=UPI00094E44B0
MHGDLLEEIEISHELNPNLWTSDDVISHERTRYVNLEEQVSTLPIKKEAAMKSKASRVYDVKYKGKDHQIPCNIEVHVSKSFHGRGQCQVKEICCQNISGTFAAKEDKGSPETLKLPSSGSMSDISLILSESDQAETDFEEINEYYISHTGPLNYSKEKLRGTSGPTMFASAKSHQATLAITEETTDIDRKSQVLQCVDEHTAQVFTDQPKNPQDPNVNMRYDPFTSSNENTKTQVNNTGFQDNMFFIDDDDDDDDLQTVESTLATAKYQQMDKNTHMACDSTESSGICCSISPDSEKYRTKTVSSSLYLPIYARQTSDNESLSSTSIDYETCVDEKSFSPTEFWTLSDTLPRLSSPDSVMSISDYRAMSPDSPLSKRKGFRADLPIMNVSWALFSSSAKCTSPEITENNADPNPSDVCDSRLQFGVIEKPAQNLDSGVAKDTPLLPDSLLIQREIPSLTSKTLPFEHLHEVTCLNKKALPDLGTNTHEYESSELDYRPYSPQSQTSHCSFSFLELLLSEPTRSQLMSQYCDYFLQYSGATPTLPQMTQNQTKLVKVSTLEIKLPSDQIFPQGDNYKTSNAYPLSHMSQSTHKTDLQCNTNEPSSHDENNLNLEEPESLQWDVTVDTGWIDNVNEKEMSVQSSTQVLKEKKESKESFLDYWFSKLAPQHSVLRPSTNDSDHCITHLRINTAENNQIKDYIDCSRMKESTEENIDPEHKFYRPSVETTHSLPDKQGNKPVIFNFVERPKYTLEFPKDKTIEVCKDKASYGDDLVQNNRQENMSFSTKVGVSMTKCSQHSEMIEQEKQKSFHFFLNSPEHTLQPRNIQSDICFKQSFENSGPKIHDSCSEKVTGQSHVTVNKPFTYEEVVYGITNKNKADAMSKAKIFESRPILVLSDSMDELPDSATAEMAMEVRPCSPESIASHCEFRALSPDSPVPHFDIAQIENYDQCFKQRSYTPQSSVSDWEGHDWGLTNLFDETRPLSPQSVSSDMELDLLFSSRALSPDSVSSARDTSLLQDWLLDFRASSPDSAASLEKCSLSADTMSGQNNRQHCNYYFRYSEDRPVSRQSTLSEVDYSELSIKDLLNESRPESPDSVSSEHFRTETEVSVIAVPTPSCARPFTYADVRGFSHERPADAMPKVTALEYGSILVLSDSFDELPDSATAEMALEVRPCSPESIASHCEIRALSPDSPVPHFDIAQIENYDQCFKQRSYTPQSSVSDWEGHDWGLTNLFDETRPLSPQSVSSDMELDLLFSSRALSPDSVSSDLDTSLLRDWLLDFRASSPDSAAVSIKDLFNYSRPESPDS